MRCESYYFFSCLVCEIVSAFDQTITYLSDMEIFKGLPNNENFMINSGQTKIAVTQNIRTKSNALQILKSRLYHVSVSYN